MIQMLLCIRIEMLTVRERNVSKTLGQAGTTFGEVHELPSPSIHIRRLDRHAALTGIRRWLSGIGD